jgi:hypothetical protein
MKVTLGFIVWISAELKSILDYQSSKAMHHKNYGPSNGVLSKSAKIINKGLYMFSNCALASNTG